MMKTYYATFMQYHPLKDNWIEIEAPDYESARQLMFKCFKDKWSFVYSEDQFRKDLYPLGKAGRTLRDD